MLRNYASELTDYGIELERVGVELDGDGVGVADLFDSDHLPGAADPVAPPGIELPEPERELDYFPQSHRGRGLEQDPDFADVPGDARPGVEVDGNDDMVTTRPPAVGLVGRLHGRRL